MHHAYKVFCDVLRSLQGLLGRYIITTAVGAILASLGLAAVEIIATYVLRDMLSLLEQHQNGTPSNQRELLVFGFWLILAGVLRWLASLTNYQCLAFSKIVISSQLRLLATFRILQKDYSSNISPAQFINFIDDTTAKTAFFFEMLITCLSSGILCFVLALSMLWNSWKETAILIGVVLILSELYLRLLKKLHATQNALPHANEELTRILMRIVRNSTLIKIFRYESNEMRAFESQTANTNNTELRFSTIGAAMSYLNPLIGIIAIAVTLNLSLVYLNTPSTRLLAFLYLLIRMVGYAANLHLCIAKLSSHFPHFNKAVEFVSQTSPEAREKATQSLNHISFFGRSLHNSELRQKSLSEMIVEGKAEMPPSPPTIHIQNLVLSVDGITPLISINELKICGGTQLGIVGPSGAGKSTLLLSIAGLISPTKGNITIDGLSPSEYLDRYRGYIGYQGPEGMLFEGSIRENLLYGCRKIPTEEECIEALRRTSLYQVILSQPEGLDTKFNTLLGILSTGERQRLSLARLLLMKPRLLFLDEPTANLDKFSERAIVEILKSFAGQCTIINVSHRPIFDDESIQILTLEKQNPDQSKAANVR